MYSSQQESIPTSSRAIISRRLAPVLLAAFAVFVVQPTPAFAQDRAEDQAQLNGLVSDLETTNSLQQVFVALDRAEAETTDPHLLARISRRRGVLNRSAGRPAIAADAFRRAYELSGGDDLRSLLDAALIEHELGKHRLAEEAARVIVAHAESYPLKRRATILAAATLAAQDDSAQALRLLRTLAQVDDAGHVEPEGLLLLERLAADEADPGMDELIRLFPDGLISYTVGAGGKAGVLVEFAPSLTTSVVGSDSTTAAGVQVGSFGDPDNAEHMVADLQALGLPAETATDGDVVRVIIRVSETLSADEALTVLESAGFQGVLIPGD